MAVFSDVDIRQELGKIISIEGFDPALLSPDSYDVDIGDVWKVTDNTAARDILEVYKNLGNRGLNTNYTLPELSAKQTRSMRTRRLNPGELYIAECTTKIETADGIKVRTVPKSGLARDGIHAFNPNWNGRIVIVSYTYSEIPEDPVAQVIFYEDPTPPLKESEMQEFYEKGRLFFSNPRFHADDRRNGYVTTRFSEELRHYNGGNLTNGDSSGRFTASGSKSMFSFYLGITEESFGTDDSCILWMYSIHGGHIYPNAPLCHANVEEQYHTLEVSLTEAHAEKILDGKHPYACSLRAYPLRTPTKKKYQGTYTDQKEPVPKRS